LNLARRYAVVTGFFGFDLTSARIEGENSASVKNNVFPFISLNCMSNLEQIVIRIEFKQVLNTRFASADSLFDFGEAIVFIDVNSQYAVEDDRPKK